MLDLILVNLFELSQALLLISFSLVIFLYLKKIKTKFAFSLLYTSLVFLFFGLSPFITLLYGGELTNANQTEIFYGYLTVFLFGLGLVLPTLLVNSTKGESKEWSLISDNLIETLDEIGFKTVLVVVLFSTVFPFIVNLIYESATYGTINFDSFIRRPYYLTVLMFLLGVFQQGCLVWGVYKVRYCKGERLSGIFIITIILLFNIFSRREILFVVYILLFFELFVSSDFKKRWMLLTLSGLIILWNFLFPFILSVRIYQAELVLLGHKDFGENLNKSFKYSLETDIKQLRAAGSMNIASRLYFMGNNLELINAIDSKYFYGDLVSFSVEKSIPRLILPSKIDPDVGDIDSKIYAKIGGYQKDMPINLPILGFLEYGLPGAFLTGVGFYFLLILLVKITSKALLLNKFVGLALLSSLILITFSLETDFIALFSSFRDAFILLAITYIILLFRKRRLIHYKE